MNVHQVLEKHLVEFYQKYGVEPDMAMYGKTLGNGYALTAVVGQKVSDGGSSKYFY